MEVANRAETLMKHVQLPQFLGRFSVMHSAKCSRVGCGLWPACSRRGQSFRTPLGTPGALAGSARARGFKASRHQMRRIGLVRRDAGQSAWQRGGGCVAGEGGSDGKEPRDNRNSGRFFPQTTQPVAQQRATLFVRSGLRPRYSMWLWISRSSVRILLAKGLNVADQYLASTKRRPWSVARSSYASCIERSGSCKFFRGSFS